MATYKCDIKKQFGKFSGLVWKASDRPGKALFDTEVSAQGAADQVVAAIAKSGFGDGDEVIFRDNAYTSLTELKTTLARAPY